MHTCQRYLLDVWCYCSSSEFVSISATSLSFLLRLPPVTHFGPQELPKPRWVHWYWCTRCVRNLSFSFHILISDQHRKQGMRTAMLTPSPQHVDGLTFMNNKKTPTDLWQGSGVFLRDLEISSGAYGYHVWVGLDALYEGSSLMKGNAWTPGLIDSPILSAPTMRFVSFGLIIVPVCQSNGA